jgi:hypothetical protein
MGMLKRGGERGEATDSRIPSLETSNPTISWEQHKAAVAPAGVLVWKPCMLTVRRFLGLGPHQ